MKICDLNSGIGQLTQAFTEFKERLADVKTHWNDDTSRQFETAHLQEIPLHLQQMLMAAQRLAEVLEKAQRECDDRGEEV